MTTNDNVKSDKYTMPHNIKAKLAPEQKDLWQETREIGENTEPKMRMKQKYEWSSCTYEQSTTLIIKQTVVIMLQNVFIVLQIYEN